MNKEDLFALYEKLYFHEIEMREKLNARTQIPLAIIIAQITLIGYILNNIKRLDNSTLSIVFYVLLVTALLFLILAVYRFVRSWYNYEYAFIPSAVDTEGYRKKLQVTYQEFEEKDQLVESALKDYIYKYYMECSSKNTENNDKRSAYYHKTASALIVSFIFTFLAFLPFYISSSEFNHHAYSQENNKTIKKEGEHYGQETATTTTSSSKKINQRGSHSTIKTEEKK